MVTKDPQHVLSDAFLAMAQASTKIGDVLTKHPFLNDQVPKGWPIPMCAYEFSAECYAMVDHYTAMMEHVDLVLNGVGKPPWKRTKAERDALVLAMSEVDEDERCRCGKLERNCDC